MRWNYRNGGSVDVFADDSDDELVTVVPVVAAFRPGHPCRCGGRLDIFRASDGAVEIVCLRCHGVAGRLHLGTGVR